jgi:hypothetical protein
MKNEGDISREPRHYLVYDLKVKFSLNKLGSKKSRQFDL